MRAHRAAPGDLRLRETWDPVGAPDEVLCGLDARRGDRAGGRVEVHLGISLALPSNRGLGDRSPQSPHLCNGSDHPASGLRGFREGTLGAQRAPKGLRYCADYGYGYGRLGPGPAAGGAGRGPLLEPESLRRREPSPPGPGAEAADRRGGSPAPPGMAAARTAAGQTTGAGRRLEKMRGGCRFSTAGALVSGPLVKPRWAQLSLPFALRRGSGSGPGL